MTQAGRHRAGDRPGPPGQPGRPLRWPRRGCCSPAPTSTTRWIRTRRLPRRARRRARARLVPRRARAVRAGGQRRSSPRRARRRWRRAAPRRGPARRARCASPPASWPARRRRRVHPDRGRADARAARAGGRGRRALAAAPSAPPTCLWRFARPHTIIGTALSVAGLYVIAAAEDARQRRRGPARHADRRPHRQHRDRRRQPAHRRRDRPGQQAVPADRGGRPVNARRDGDRHRLHGAPARDGAHAGRGRDRRGRRRPRGRRALLAPAGPPEALPASPPRCASPACAASSSTSASTGTSRTTSRRRCWALCLFVLPFSFAIAVLKDVPDIEGDRAYRIRTFTVRLGPERVFEIGLAALALAYGGMILLGPSLLAGRRPAGGPGRRSSRRRGAALACVAQTRRPARPSGVHPLLHAGLGALLPGVPPRAAGLPGGLTFGWTSGREQTADGSPKRRGQASTRQVGLSAMSIASEADQQPRSGSAPADPAAALPADDRAEHHHGLPGARRAAAGGPA